jgi:hypothetical protein
VPGYRNPIDSTSLLRPPVAPREVCAVNSAVSELIANTLLVVGAFVSDCQPARADPHPAIVVYPRVYRCVDFMEASSWEFVGDGERQRAVLVRNRWNLRHVESNDLC